MLNRELWTCLPPPTPPLPPHLQTTHNEMIPAGEVSGAVRETAGYKWDY